MLDEFILIAERLKLHAQGIGQEIVRQADLLKLLNSKADKARANL